MPVAIRSLLVAFAVVLAGLAVPGIADARTPARGVAGVTMTCGPAPDYSCTSGGYAGKSEGWPGQRYGNGQATSNRFGLHNCTLYAAYRIAANGVGDPGWNGNAKQWPGLAKAKGTPVDGNPAVGAVAAWTSSEFGHVAYVEKVTDTGIEVTDDNYDIGPTGNTTSRWTIAKNSPAWPDNFIHFKDVASAPPPAADLARHRGTIVQWDADKKAQKTAWFVTPDLKRLWIPDGGTYNCLKSRGVGGPTPLPSSVLDRLPDQINKRAACGDTLLPDRVLRRDMNLRSSDGRYTLWLQGDGHLVLYGPSGRALWANNQFAGQFLIMQGDGNVVTYTDSGGATWSTRTTGTGGNRLVVQNDGNLVVYAGNRPVWASNTAGRT